jgi:hypothetical protein
MKTQDSKLWREIPLPPREGLELMLNVAMNLEYRIERASRGRVKKTSTKPMNPRWASMSNKIVVPYAKYAYCYDHTLIFSQTSKPHWRMLTEGFMLQQLLGESGEEDLENLQVSNTYFRSIETNLLRRHLTAFQRVELAKPLLEIKRELARQRQLPFFIIHFILTCSIIH